MKHLRYSIPFFLIKVLPIKKNKVLGTHSFSNPVSDSTDIILRPNSIDLEPFLMTLVNAPSETRECDYQFVRGILESMDTEWDRKCATALLGMSRSWSEMTALGIDPRLTVRATKQAATVINE